MVHRTSRITRRRNRTMAILRLEGLVPAMHRMIVRYQRLNDRLLRPQTPNQ